MHFPLGSADAERIGALLARCQLQPIALNYCGSFAFDLVHVLNNPKDAHAYRRMLRTVLKQADQLGIPMVLTVVGLRTESSDRADRLRCAAEVISEIADEANEMGIRVAIEVPHVYQLTYNVAKVAEFFDQVTSPHVGACADSSHWGILDYDFDQFMSVVGDRLCHIHLRDASGEDTADFKQELELTPGKGEVDFAKFAGTLDKYGYAGEVTLELEYRGGVPLEQIEQEVDYGLAYLTECGWELPDRVGERLEMKEGR
jgi:sugar phosphate isomerase/epimerase